MQKKLLMAAMVTGMAFMLFACGNDGDSETTAQATTEATVASVETTQEVTTVEETTKKKKKKKEETTEETTTVNKTTTPAPTTVEPTTKKIEKATKKKKEKTSKKSNDSGKATAKKYVGKSLNSLVAAVGKYKSSEKAPSCMYEGEQDGIFVWKDFSVSAHTDNGKWIIDSIF